MDFEELEKKCQDAQVNFKAYHKADAKTLFDDDDFCKVFAHAILVYKNFKKWTVYHFVKLNIQSNPSLTIINR